MHKGSKRFHRRFLVVATVLGLTLIPMAGCGSDTSLNSVTGSGSGSGSQVANSPSNYILGRAKLDVARAGDQVEIVDRNGTVLYRFVTEHEGYFGMPGQLPQDFVVLVHRGSDTYARVVQGGWSDGVIYINAGSTLVAALLASNPALGVAGAEKKVHDYLKLPSGYETSWISTVRTSSYNPSTFYRGVAQAGSLEAYLRQEVGAINSSAPNNKSLLEYTFGFLGNVGSNVRDSLINDSAGEVSSRMGYNFTTAGALSNILQELGQVLSDLNAIQNQMNLDYVTGNLSDTIRTLNQSTDGISSYFGGIQSAVNATIVYNENNNIPYNQPVENLSGNITVLQNSLSSINVDNVTTPILTSLTGGTNTSNYGLSLNSQVAQVQMAAYKLDDASAYGNYPWRSSYLSRQQNAFVGKYVNVIAQAAYVAYEVAASGPVSDTAARMSKAISTADDWSGQCQLATSYLADELGNDEVMVDLVHKKIWYRVFQPATYWADARNRAANFNIGNYKTKNWRLPTQQEITDLVESRALPNTGLGGDGTGWDNANTSVWTGAFEKIGFDTTNYVAYSQNNHPGRSDDEGAWMLPASYDLNGVPNSDTIFFWNNTKNNPSTSELQANDETSSYLICADYPTPDDTAQTQAKAGNASAFPVNAEQTLSPFSGGGTLSDIEVRVLDGNSFGTQMDAQASYPPYPQKWDVTLRSFWKSDNPAVATVSNLVPNNDVPQYPAPIPLPAKPPGFAGFVTWHPPIEAGDPPLTSVNISCTRAGLNSSGQMVLVQGTKTISPPAGLKPKLNTVQYFPVNSFVDLAGTESQTTLFLYLYAYYQDGRIINVSTRDATTWVLKDANGNVLNSPDAGFAQDTARTKNRLSLSRNIPTDTLYVTATYDGGSFGSANCTGQIFVDRPLTSNQR